MINVTQTNSIATITIEDCRPLSRHDVDFGFALRDAVRDTADSDEIKAIIIRVVGDDFCPALSAAELAGMSPEREHRYGSGWHEAYAASSGLYQNLCFCKKVVITEVRGECADAGSMVVLCSDLTVATPDSKFGSPFSVIPEANLVLAALTMRLNRAKSWVLSEVPLYAQEAFDAGLVNRIVAADLLDATVTRMARSVTRMPLDGITMSKINMETCLDAQGVGREFDMAGFYALAMRRLIDRTVTDFQRQKT
jgi:enoyl-CoA hydratase/carnithine racemase